MTDKPTSEGVGVTFGAKCRPENGVKAFTLTDLTAARLDGWRKGREAAVNAALELEAFANSASRLQPEGAGSWAARADALRVAVAKMTAIPEPKE